MKKHLPYNVLLVLAIGMAGLVVYYNVIWRERYVVRITYPVPAPSHSALAASNVASQLPAAESQPSGSPSQAQWEPIEPEMAGVQFPLELNTATYEQLVLIPGVGDVMAQRILQYRDVLGSYERLEQLTDIHGIGPAVYRQIEVYLFVGGQQPDDYADDGINEDNLEETDHVSQVAETD